MGYIFLITLTFLLAGFLFAKFIDGFDTDSLFLLGGFGAICVVISAGLIYGLEKNEKNWEPDCIHRGGGIEMKVIKVDGHDPQYFSTCTYPKPTP